ncbi:MAG TPA: DUF1707 domain-containing protein [Streptosporangiaceae bacterium]
MSEWHERGSVVTDGRAGAGPMLAADADRDAVAGQLSSALGEGRLTAGEHAERVEAAYTARTLGELGALTADLPAPARGAAGRWPAPATHGEVHRCLMCALLILCPPAGIAWLLAARRRAPTSGGAPVAGAEGVAELAPLVQR